MNRDGFSLVVLSLNYRMWEMNPIPTSGVAEVVLLWPFQGHMSSTEGSQNLRRAVHNIIVLTNRIFLMQPYLEDAQART